MKSELKYLYKIDNQEWFGSDNGIEFPKNELTTINLKTGTQNEDMETSKMVCPNFSAYLCEHQVKLKTNKNYKILYSLYSDGTGI